MNTSLLMNKMWEEDVTPEELARIIGISAEAFFQKAMEGRFTEKERWVIKVRLRLSDGETQRIFGEGDDGKEG